MQNSFNSPLVENAVAYRRKRTASLPWSLPAEVVSNQNAIIRPIVSPPEDDNRDTAATIANTKRQRVHHYGEELLDDSPSHKKKIKGHSDFSSTYSELLLTKELMSQEMMDFQENNIQQLISSSKEENIRNSYDYDNSARWTLSTDRSFDSSTSSLTTSTQRFFSSSPKKYMASDHFPYAKDEDPSTRRSCVICCFPSSKKTDIIMQIPNSITTAKTKKCGVKNRQQSLLQYFPTLSASPMSMTGLFKQLPQDGFRPSPSYPPESSFTLLDEEPTPAMQPRRYLVSCTYCDRAVCCSTTGGSQTCCSIVCQHCSKIFCSTSCSIINYSRSYERVFCLDCNEHITMAEQQQYSAALVNGGCLPSLSNGNSNEADAMVLE
jgi:hypothetical protein